MLEEPKIKIHYSCKAEIPEIESYTFTLDLYDNIYTKNLVDMETGFQKAFDYSKFDGQLLLYIRVDYTGELTGELEYIEAGDIYLEYDDSFNKRFYLSMQLAGACNAYKIGKLTGHNVLREIIDGLQDYQKVNIECSVPEIPNTIELIELRINNCIDMEDSNIGVYLENIGKFINLINDNDCIWKTDLPVQNNMINFKTIHYKSTTSDKFPVERNYNVSELNLGESKDNCTLTKEEGKFILNCTFE